MSLDRLTITLPLARRLRREYDKALGEGGESFVFEGRTVLVAYAYYLLVYLAGLLNAPDLEPKERPKPKPDPV